MPKTIELKITIENMADDTDISPLADGVRNTLSKEYADGVEISTESADLPPKTVILKAAEIKVVMDKLPDAASEQAIADEVRSMLAAQQIAGVKISVSIAEASQAKVDEVKASSKAKAKVKDA